MQGVGGGGRGVGEDRGGGWGDITELDVGGIIKTRLTGNIITVLRGCC